MFISKEDIAMRFIEIGLIAKADPFMIQIENLREAAIADFEYQTKWSPFLAVPANVQFSGTDSTYLMLKGGFTQIYSVQVNGEPTEAYRPFTATTGPIRALEFSGRLCRADVVSVSGMRGYTESVPEIVNAGICGYVAAKMEEQKLVGMGLISDIKQGDVQYSIGVSGRSSAVSVQMERFNTAVKMFKRHE